MSFYPITKIRRWWNVKKWGRSIVTRRKSLLISDVTQDINLLCHCHLRDKEKMRIRYLANLSAGFIRYCFVKYPIGVVLGTIYWRRRLILMNLYSVSGSGVRWRSCLNCGRIVLSQQWIVLFTGLSSPRAAKITLSGRRQAPFPYINIFT